jgi:hypothetical protein
LAWAEFERRIQDFRLDRLARLESGLMGPSVGGQRQIRPPCYPCQWRGRTA